MKLSKKAEKELKELGRSDKFRNDMETLRSAWETPFFRNGRVDTDAYIEFVVQFNEFINHEPKPFRPIIDKVMKL